MYVIGKTGTGKSTLLERLILSDIEAGEGLVLVDPHGDLVERIVARVPAHRKGDVIFLDVPNSRQPYGYNPLKRVHPRSARSLHRGSSKSSRKCGRRPGASGWSISFATRSLRFSISRKRRCQTFPALFG